MYLLKARERLQDVEREEAKERRRRELGVQDLRIVRGAVDTDGIPEDGPPGAKMKAKVCTDPTIIIKWLLHTMTNCIPVI